MSLQSCSPLSFSIGCQGLVELRRSSVAALHRPVQMPDRNIKLPGLIVSQGLVVVIEPIVRCLLEGFLIVLLTRGPPPNRSGGFRSSSSILWMLSLPGPRHFSPAFGGATTAQTPLAH